MNIKKISTIVSCVAFFFVFLGESVFAKENLNNENIPHVEYTLEITDNDTGEKKALAVEDEDVKFTMIELDPNLTTFNKNFVTPSSMDIGDDERLYSGYGVPSAYEEFVSIRNRFKNFAVILYI